MRGRKPNAPSATSSDAPECPSFLGSEARREWARVVPLLVAGSVVQKVDLALLAAYCSTFVLWVEMQGQLTASNIVNEQGKLNPLARHCESTLKQLRGLLDQLGFTPAARRQILTGASALDPLEEALR